MRSTTPTPPAAGRTRTVAAATGLALVLCLLAGSCSTPTSTTTSTTTAPALTPAADTTTVPGPPPTSVTEGRPYTVTLLNETFVDTRRPTSPNGTVATPAASRSLPTTIHLPTGTGPAPLIVFSHGLGGSPAKFTRLHQAWAEAGYVVAAPRFPLTSDANPDHRTDAADLINQPADVSFVIDEMLAASDAGTGALAGRIDAERIGAAGLSLGGATTYGVVLNDCCIDPRIASAVVMAGAILITTGANDTSRNVPIFALHGDADLALPYRLGRSAWESLDGPSWLATLVGGDHAGPFEDPSTPWDDAVVAATIAYWDATLGGLADGFTRLQGVADSSGGLVTLESRPG